jgi:hypothetical protein
MAGTLAAIGWFNLQTLQNLGGDHDGVGGIKFHVEFFGNAISSRLWRKFGSCHPLQHESGGAGITGMNPCSSYNHFHTRQPDQHFAIKGVCDTHDAFA